MNYRLIIKLIGNIVCVEAVLMLLPLSVSIIYGEGDMAAFLWSIPILAVIGVGLSLLKPKDKTFHAKEAFAATTFSWLTVSLLGSLPFIFSGQFESVTDSIFEAISGFTTTGASILTDIESLPRGILFWRSFSHFIGGGGVLMFIMAVMPHMGASTVNLMKAEFSGPAPDKIVPKMRETAIIIYSIYIAMTAVLIILLLIAGLPVYDALVTAFATTGTGGFSVMNASISGYGNAAVEIIVTVFMALSGISFALYFMLVTRKVLKVINDGELKFYLCFIIISIAVILVNNLGMYDRPADAIRDASFQVVSIVSTTGFSTADFNLWPPLSQFVLLILMILGGSAGSTAGGLKMVRFIILFKAIRVMLGKIFHPGIVEPVTINKRRIDSALVSKTAVYFFIYISITLITTLLVTIEGNDILTSLTASISMLSNIGPGLGDVGPASNFSAMTDFSKILLSLCMIVGRLEFIPVLVLLTPYAWKRR